MSTLDRAEESCDEDAHSREARHKHGTEVFFTRGPTIEPITVIKLTERLHCIGNPSFISSHIFIGYTSL